MGKQSTSSKSSSSDDSDSSSSSSVDSEKYRKEMKKLKKKLKREEKRREKRLKKKLKNERRKLKKEKKKKREDKKEHSAQCDDTSKDKVEKSSNIPIKLMEASKAMAPMTKEEWEKRQSVVRRVLDEESGRYRLIKGDGEVLEEIVSYKQHKEINKKATLADGDFFQSKTVNKNPKK